MKLLKINNKGIKYSEFSQFLRRFVSILDAFRKLSIIKPICSRLEGVTTGSVSKRHRLIAIAQLSETQKSVSTLFLKNELFIKPEAKSLSMKRAFPEKMFLQFLTWEKNFKRLKN